MPAGTHLGGDDGQLPVVLVDLVELATDELEWAVDRVATEQQKRRTFKPLFVSSASTHEVFARHGFLFEHVMSAEHWACLRQPPADWKRYARRRLAAIRRDYGPEELVTIRPGDSLDRMAEALPSPRRQGPDA